MKKSLLALAVAGAFSSAAFAQSSVTLFGVADTGYTYVKGDGNGNIKGMSISGLNSSRIGVRGTEDLGSGLKANFWFEAGVSTDSGAGAATNTNNQSTGSTTTGLSFNRRMFVGLSGGFGEVRLGRNYTPIFMQITSNDPFGTNGVGETNIEVLSGLVPGNAVIQTTVRESNAIEYLTPPGIGGVYVHGMFALGENASNAGTATVGTNDGRAFGVRLGWAGGPADISVAYNKTDYLQLAAQGNYTVMGIGGTLTFGAFKPMFQYVKHKIDITNAVAQDPERTDFLLGLVASFGATDLRLAYNNYNVKHVTANASTACPTCTNDDAVQFSIGPVYNLSRRTAVYGTYSLVDNKGSGNAFAVQTTGVGARPTTVPGGKSTGFEVGLRHSF